MSDWIPIMFTDKSRFALQPENKCVRVWREKGTRNRLENITKHRAFCDGSIVEQDFIGIFYAAAVGPLLILMDDNVHPHRDAIVDGFLDNEGIVHMEWRVYLPDLIRIEYLRDAPGHAVCRCFPSPATFRDLETALQEE